MMNAEERPASEIIGVELDKIRAALADYPQLQGVVFPCLEQIKAAAESALPCPVLPAISLKEYGEQLPTAQELLATVQAAGPHFVFHGYTFWLGENQSWSLTNPHGLDDVMTLRDLEDFEDFLDQLRLGNVIGF